MSAETEKAHGAGMPPGFPELWESVTRARMDIAELKGMVKMHFSDKAHHTPPCATARFRNFVTEAMSMRCGQGSQWLQYMQWPCQLMRGNEASAFA